jgi:flagella basal body P-ring formation protein FlgA
MKESAMTRSLLLVALAAAAAPAGATDLAALERRAIDFAGAGIGEEGGPAQPIDRRLRLADCAQTPELSWRTERRDAIVIRCADPGSWRIFVPVRAAAPAASPSAARAVTARAEPVIRRGDLVTLSADSAGFSVSSDGVAMGDAAPGARFAVRIAGARAPVQAIATEAGRATLPGW